MCLQEFVKSAPVGFEPDTAHSYKYFASGKGCTLGVLFEDSLNVYFEWLTEDGGPVTYEAAVRYKAWPKHEFARLISRGVWEVTDVCDAPDAVIAS